jgi:beta-carotene 15,15'-dioxygenase
MAPPKARRRLTRLWGFTILELLFFTKSLNTYANPIASAGMRIWILPAVTAMLLLIHATWDSLNSLSATMVAAIAILLGGIPHGTLDIEIAANRYGQSDTKGKVAITAIYLLVALSMVMIWLVAPAVALTAFLILSIVHFAADWQTGNERFLGAMVGWALIATPALSHSADVASIFEMLTGDDSGATVAALLACTAPPAVLGTLVYCYWCTSRGNMMDAVDVACCMIASIFLPPLFAFMLFFCGLHSPRHMADALQEAGVTMNAQTLTKIALVFGLSLGIGAILYSVLSGAAGKEGIIGTAFILISVLTVPHFLLEMIAHRKIPLTQ